MTKYCHIWPYIWPYYIDAVTGCQVNTCFLCCHLQFVSTVCLAILLSASAVSSYKADNLVVRMKCGQIT